jgi:universal stress protein A
MKVLVAIDDSQQSRAALHSVTKRAWHDATNFVVLNVFQPKPALSGAYASDETEDRDPSRSRERSFRDDLVNNAVSYIQTLHPNCTVEGKVVNGDAATEILSMANKIDADLIVLGTHGRRGLARVIVGSVAESVLKDAVCSVEIVKTGPLKKTSGPETPDA